MPKGVFRMKKLLLVLLVPVMVLGLMVGCGYETGVEVDAYLQGQWRAVTITVPANAGPDGGVFPALGAHDLFITPNEMTVRYTSINGVESVPFNIQFKYGYPTRGGREYQFARSNAVSPINLGAQNLNATVESKAAFFDSLKLLDRKAFAVHPTSQAIFAVIKAIEDFDEDEDTPFSLVEAIEAAMIAAGVAGTANYIEFNDPLLPTATTSHNVWNRANSDIVIFNDEGDLIGGDADSDEAIALLKAWFVELMFNDMRQITGLVGSFDANSFAVSGELLVSDYRSGAELAKLATVVLSQSKNNVIDTQSIAFFGLKYSDNVPLYMLQVPLAVGKYRQ